MIDACASGVTFSHEPCVIASRNVRTCIDETMKEKRYRTKSVTHCINATLLHLIWFLFGIRNRVQTQTLKHWHKYKPMVMHMKSYFHININTLGFASNPISEVELQVQVQTSIWHLTCVVRALSSSVYRLTCICRVVIIFNG